MTDSAAPPTLDEQVAQEQASNEQADGPSSTSQIHRCDDNECVLSLSKLVDELSVNQRELEGQNTQLRQTKRQLEEAVSQYRHLWNSAPIGYFIHDRNGNILNSNSRAIQLLGLDEEARQHGNLWSLLTAVSFGVFAKHLRLSLAGEESPTSELCFRRPDHRNPTASGTGESLIWVRATTEKMDDGTLQTAIVDETPGRLERTRRESLEASLRQNQKMEVLYQLSGGMAHDFNNVLQALVMNAELAKLNVTDLSVLTDLIDQILQTAHRGAELTKRLLAFSRRSPLQLYPIDLSQLVRDSVRIVRRSLGKRIRMETNTNDCHLSIMGDPIQIEQALLNLCLNARDAMQGKGTLTVSTELRELTAEVTFHNLTIQPGSYAILRVQDAGPGIPNDVLPQIFEPCFTTKDIGKGTGLGLSVVYGIAKQYDGGVDAYNHRDGGACFELYLPIATSTASKRSRETAPGFTAPKTKTRVLLVEDEIVIRQVIEKSFQNAGFEVLSVSDGEQALDVIRQAKVEIDILLSDVVLKGISGKEVCKQFRSVFPDALVVLMSGHGESVLDPQFLLEQRAKFLRKPFKTNDLFAKLYEDQNLILT